MPEAAAHPQRRPCGPSIGNAGDVDVLWFVVAVVVCAGMLYLGYRIEPHRVSKDGMRFLCTGQWLTPANEPDGRKREVWITVLNDGQMQVDVKKRMHRDLTHWMLEGRSPSPPQGRAVYVLRSVNQLGQVQRMTIKLPAKSRAVGALDAVLARKTANPPSSPTA